MTAAGARFIKGAQYGSAEGYFLHAGTVEWLEAQVAAIEAEAAARAVDEALSVERVKAAILSVGMENPHWSWRCEYPAKGESKCDLGDEAADLVAHLRGPRP